MPDEILPGANESPSIAEKFAKQAHDLDAARKTVEDAASVSAGLWLSYLFVLLYIAIAAGGVTHKDLLLENPVKLPFLNVELPLVAFFFLAPILFIVSHAYTLVHFVMLAAKVGVYDAELRAQLVDAPETREDLRRQLPSNIFVQFLAGPSDIRKGGLGWLLKAIAWISVVIGPVLLLLLIQAQFLPYHLEWVTWVQRIAVLVDVTLLWALWPAVLNGRSEIKWPRLWRYPVLTLASLVPMGLAFTAATFPGEAMDDWIGNKQWIPLNLVAVRLGQKDSQEQPIQTSFHDLLFNGEVDSVTRRRKSLFSNTLVLPYFDALEAAKIDDPKKLDSVKHTLVLRGRHLESAVFDNADLRKVDLTRAQLQHAKLDHAQFQRATLSGAELQGASLREAQLQGATFRDAAHFQDPSLDAAQLQGASLDWARLQGASLDWAQLQGASLRLAQFQGASLHYAHLQGAMLNDAGLQGASLHGAQLQGAWLQDVQLQGASLYNTQLQGADFGGFGGATLAGTDMSGAAVWPGNFAFASLIAVFEHDLKKTTRSKDEIATVQAIVIKEVPEGKERDDALERIETSDPWGGYGNEASAREILEKGSVDEATYQKYLADQLKSLACSGDEYGPYIVRGLIANDRVKDTGAQASGLVEAILKPDCPVSTALTEQDKADLRKLANDLRADESKH